MRTVKEVSRLTGVSVRTLHHYDAIGLLKPTYVTKAGYRMYDDAALGRLQNILLFRELQFPLKEIRAILDSPGFDQAEVIARQIELLELQYRHIGELISLARDIQSKGAATMHFEAFDKSEMEQYRAEAKARWGTTQAWQDFAQRPAAQSKEEQEEAANRLLDIFAGLGTLRHLSPDARKVQEKIAALQQFITDHYYTCTDEILNGLGQMYAEDERFRKTIDRAGGEGTAEFVSRAIFSAQASTKGTRH